MILDWIKSKPIQALSIAVVLLLALTLFVNWNSARNSGNEFQTTLNAQYKDNQNILSICENNIEETANVTKAEAATFKAAMIDTVKGRYQQPGSSALPSEGKLFSAIIENYPDLSGLNDAFTRVYTVIVGCRNEYKGQQSKLLDELRAFDRWKNATNQGRYFGWGFPSNNLVARIDATHRYTGKAAYERMYDIVKTESANDAYKSGILKSKNPLGATE